MVAFFALKPTGERDVVRWATEITDLKTINPVLASESSQVRLVYLTYDTLMRIGSEGEPQFWAATALDAVDDTTLDATIREGMTFHDGNPVTAEDVAFTFNYMQYGRYILNMLTGNFGVSFNRGIAVSEILGEALAHTVVLMLPSLVLAYLFGVTGGALIAWKRNSKTDRIVSTTAMIFRSAPIFWLCIIAVALFSIQFEIFPAGHMRTPGSDYEGLLETYFSLDFLHHLFLPMAVMAVYYGCYPLIVMRTSMLEVLGDDFIDLCKAKGLSEARIVFGVPLLPFAIIALSLLDRSTWWIIVLMAMLFWPITARVVRSQVLSLRERSFIDAARISGAGHLRILYRHIAPNVMPQAFVHGVFGVAWAITTEASINFLGFGDPYTVSWGTIIYDVFTSMVSFKAWWWFVPPGLCIIIVTTAFYFIGQAFEEVANPRLRER